MNKNSYPLLLALLIFTAAFSRFIPHPPNFTPVGGIALFGAAYFNRKWFAILVPFAALWISSFILDNTVYAQYYDGIQWFSNLWVYLGFVAIVLLGFWRLKKVTVWRVASSSLVASALFFVISNFGSWLDSGLYPKTWEGLTAAYLAGLPFFWNTLTGDLFFVTVLFGLYYLIAKYVPGVVYSR